MNKYVLLFSLFCLGNLSVAQDITSDELLNKAIEYHDPHNNWPKFIGQFTVTMTTSDSAERVSEICIDLLSEYFSLYATKQGQVTGYVLDKDECKLSLNGKSDLSQDVKADSAINCERANLYKNYYTFLYGLPMKLRDPGTVISDEVKRRKFMGKEYYVLNVTYDSNIGSDVWFFYFDPITFALEVYQFFKSDDNGELIPESGEYILLSEVEVLQGVKMPKIRKWYYNRDDSFLGTDTLN